MIWQLLKELAVNRLSIRTLTWGTLLAALLSAFVLAASPDPAPLGGGSSAHAWRW